MSSQIEQYNPEAIEFRRMLERLKLMIANGRKLSDAEAQALAQFAVAEKLDPFAGEVYLLKNEKTNDILGPMVGVKGLRRKAQERLGDSDSYFPEFVLINPPSPEVLFAYECRLRDTKTMRQYLAMRRDAEEMFRASGSKTPSDEAAKLVGPPPVYIGVGYFYKAELNEYKDRKFSPQEKAQKRAEATALKKRFSLNYDVGDNGDHGVIDVVPEVVQGETTEIAVYGGIEYPPDTQEDELPIEQETPPEPPAATMDLETARATRTPEGLLYGNLGADDLKAIIDGISSALDTTAKITPARREDLTFKRDAAKTVLASMK